MKVVLLPDDKVNLYLNPGDALTLSQLFQAHIDQFDQLETVFYSYDLITPEALSNLKEIVHEGAQSTSINIKGDCCLSLPYNDYRLIEDLLHNLDNQRDLKLSPYGLTDDDLQAIRFALNNPTQAPQPKQPRR
jgi:hypothetical protein